MRQNCRPQVVNLPSSAKTTTVHTAAITQALATHSTDVTNSSAQSRDGVKVSMPGSYPAPRLNGDGLVALDSAESPFAVAKQLEFVGVMLLDRGAVADADHNGFR